LFIAHLHKEFFMSKKNLFCVRGLLRTITLLVGIVLAFALVGCDNGTSGGGGGGNPQTVTYTGTADGGGTYTLKITENTSRAAYTPKEDDEYEIIFVIGGITRRSRGKVITISGSTITLKPSNTETGTIITTVSGNSISSITAPSGVINWDDGTPFTAPGTLIPGEGGNPPVAGSVHVSMSAGPGANEFTLTLSRGQWAAGSGYFHYIGDIDTLAFIINPSTYTDSFGQSKNPSFNYRRMGDTDKDKLVIQMEVSNTDNPVSVGVRFGSNELMVSSYLMGYMDIYSMNPIPSSVSYDKNQAAVTVTATP
jgi:hypothetical protein